MDEYSPKHYDIAQLRFLCENLRDESIATLGDSSHGWVNDPTSAVNLQLNELIEHIAAFIVTYKIKYPNDEELCERVEKYLDDTYILFSNYGINDGELRRWQKSRSQLFRMFSEKSICTAVKT
ncbi:Hha toxicity modulator TomB [Pectobacteriaceae bacterium CE70]|uniref:Biofilm formation regulator YbaJ n=1 Tax=Serratia sp. (strain ATCC 39006) TaxID=104623 RepID=A0A2I5TN67_SERS3|nr:MULTISPECIES: Hha toxicity modulator TomB [Enterobacterales]WJV59442.1 Hha toxicity modulator TomB [Pectobacteriaceae bacterium C111]WJV63685.1 Hha toxicity modulator TomB [Pectobacteriaceae bacterium C52]WJV68080.1 Hha toxicity modulator TomB [Pectobacteriaceae bacterium CE70]WJY12020.1 Hha toxicity modulator TomB [Pectobacteriaceae bacterium C80]WJY14025.1 Hha toxicity modulator TomB [Pectobacteriaceae bacterium CE90]